MTMRAILYLLAMMTGFSAAQAAETPRGQSNSGQVSAQAISVVAVALSQDQASVTAPHRALIIPVFATAGREVNLAIADQAQPFPRTYRSERARE